MPIFSDWFSSRTWARFTHMVVVCCLRNDVFSYAGLQFTEVVGSLRGISQYPVAQFYSSNNPSCIYMYMNQFALFCK